MTSRKGRRRKVGKKKTCRAVLDGTIGYREAGPEGREEEGESARKSMLSKSERPTVRETEREEGGERERRVHMYARARCWHIDIRLAGT